MTHIGVVPLIALTVIASGLAPAAGVSSTGEPVPPLPTVFTSVKFPSGTHPARAKGAKVVGTVTNEGQVRRVWLQVKAEQGWVTLEQTKTDSAGAFELPAPTYWVNESTMRVHAPATDTFAAGTSLETGKIIVTRTYTPRPGNEFTRLGSGARWNPCRQLTYKVNPRRMPRKGLPNVKEAFRRVTEATGLRFRYAGKTKYVGWKGGSYKAVKGADIGIAWARPSMVPVLAGGTVGYAGGSSMNGFYTSGAVSIDSTARLRPGFQGGRSSRTGTLLVHEIGHVVGLGHVEDTRQVLTPILTRLEGQPAGGDLRGMDVVGADGGCPAADQARGTSAMPVLVDIAD